MKPENAVIEYQCPGCVGGPFPECYKSENSIECRNHVPGTLVSGIGKVFLGLPRGFNRLGTQKEVRISIFESLDDAYKKGWSYDKLNIPVWQHLDQHGNTIVRGISPRINNTWIHIFLNEVVDEIDCLLITEQDIENMD